MEQEKSYTDNTILTWGPHKFTSLYRIPADYLLKIQRTGCHDKALNAYIKNNLEKIIARAEGKIPTPTLETCEKVIYPSKQAAKTELKRICSLEQDHKKPVRAYECEKCGGWHLTSISLDDWELRNSPN